MARSAVVLFLPLILSSVLSLASPGVLSANTNPEHEQFVAYWTLEPGWHSEFQLRNNMLGKELTVKPFLRTSDGSEVALDPIVIPQDDVRMIDLRVPSRVLLRNWWMQLTRLALSSFVISHRAEETCMPA